MTWSLTAPICPKCQECAITDDGNSFVCPNGHVWIKATAAIINPIQGTERTVPWNKVGETVLQDLLDWENGEEK